MTNEQIAQHFLEVIEKHYAEYKGKLTNMLKAFKDEFDEDVYHTTILKCYETIVKNGLKDTSEQGCLNYFFRAFRTNNLAEKVSTYNTRKTDAEVEDMKIIDEDDLERQQKIEEEVQKVLEIVKNEFPEDLPIFKAKYFHNLTYRQVAKFYQVPDAKRRICHIKRYIKDNYK